MDSREILLDKAESLFARRGVDAVGVQEVVESAGLTKPSLYHHFGSKEGLVRAILERGFAELDAALDGVGPYEHDLPTYLERQARAWLSAVRARPDWFSLELSLVFLSSENPMAALARPGTQALAKRIDAVFLKASRQYGNMKGRHRLLGAAWLGLLNNWTGMRLGGWAEPDDAFVREATRIFLYGIFT